METIAESCRRHRLARGLTQDEVAGAAGISRKTLSEFENGGSGITLANLQRLMRALGLALTVREASTRPTLDELAERYEEAEHTPVRRRAGRKKAS